MLFKFIIKRKNKNFQKKFKFDINNWMDLTKEERLQIDFNEKDQKMKQKKELLKSIRDDYLKIMKNK